MKPCTSMNRRMWLCLLLLAIFTFQTIPVRRARRGMWTFNTFRGKTSNENMAST